MKKLYFLLSATLISLSSFAQTDLGIVNLVQTNDTFVIQTTGGPTYTFSDTFFNLGPTALSVTDTIFFRTPYHQPYIRLTLPVGGLPVGSSVYFNDTLSFVSGGIPTGPYSGWCDTVWAKNVNSVVITDALQGNNKTCKTVYIKNNTLGIGSQPIVGSSASNGKMLNVYPNPATNLISLDYYSNNINDACIMVSDIMGRKVYQKNLGAVSGAQKVDVDVNNFSNGIYIVELRVGESKQVGRFVIQK